MAGYGSGYGIGYGGPPDTAIALDDIADAGTIPAGRLDGAKTASNRIWKQYEGRASWVAMASVLGGIFDEVDDQHGSILNG